MVRQAADVIQRIESLPSTEQTVLARFLSTHFDDVLAEARWEDSVKSASEFLDQLATEVDLAIAKGQVKELDPEEL